MGKKLKNHFLTGMAAFEFMRDFSFHDNFSSLVFYSLSEGIAVLLLKYTNIADKST